MGVLYAKVAGAWVPILSSVVQDPVWSHGYPTYDPRYVNVDGDTMTGLLTVYGGGSLSGASAPVTGGMLRVGQPGSAQLFIDNNDLQAAAADGTGTALSLNNTAVGGGVNISTNGPGGCNICTGAAGDGVVSIGAVGGANPINLRGARVTVDNSIPLNFGSTTRQMINLYGSDNGPYGLGVQGGAFYSRSGGDFYWYKNGTHSDTNGASGSGGWKLMWLDGTNSRLCVGDWTSGTNNNAAPLQIFGPNPGGCRLEFFHGAQSNGRSGAVGFQTDTSLQLRVERTGAEGPVLWNTNTGAQSIIRFGTQGTENARFHPNGDFQCGNTGNTIQEVGASLIGRLGQIWGACNVLNTPPLILNKHGAAWAAGSDQVHFRLDNTTRGSIVHDTTTSTKYNTTSDYRLKTDRGPIANAVERVMRLRPIRFIWNESPEAGERDGFLAHELAEVVPDAVTGEKDAVASEADVENNLAKEVGEIMAQSADNGRVVPLLAAAIQQLIAEVTALRAEVATLKGAA